MWNQINFGDGFKIPSLMLIQQLLLLGRDEDDLLRQRSNEILPVVVEKLTSDWMTCWWAMARKLDFDVEALQRAGAIRMYCKHLLASPHIYERLSDYQEADQLGEQFNNRRNTIHWSRGDGGEFTKELVLKMVFYANEYNLANRRKKASRHLPTIAHCRYCHTYFSFKRGRGVSCSPPHCDSDQCRRDYERTRKPRRGAEWKSINKRRCCKECGNRRLVNSKDICKKCYRQAGSEKIPTIPMPKSRKPTG